MIQQIKLSGNFYQVLMNHLQQILQFETGREKRKALVQELKELILKVVFVDSSLKGNYKIRSWIKES